MQTIADLIRWSTSRFNEAELFFGHGTDNALDEAVLLISQGLHLPLDLPVAYLASRITNDEREQLAQLLTKRIQQRIPVPYLTGEAYFAGLRFLVNDQVLIPRSPIAELIERGFSPWLDLTEVDSDTPILDLCTGSGCIAIACAHYFPNLAVDAVDLSPSALAIAQENVQLHGMEDQVHLIQSDLFADLDSRRYRLIVSNPPYVSEQELAALPPEYHHEPRIGLAGGDDGLNLVRHILATAADYLTDQGALVLEVGYSAERLQQCYPQVPFWWLEFERGGEGVFLLTKEQLQQYRHLFKPIQED